MFRHHLKTIARNLQRNVGYSFINVFGLGIGIAASFVILMFVQQELSYEKHFSHHEQTYRIGTKFMSMGSFAKASELVFNTVNEEFPYIEKSSKVDRTGEVTLSIADFEVVKSGLYVDSSFFEIFDYEFEYGSRSKAFNSPNNIVITQELSESLFGTKDAIGRVIEIDNRDSINNITAYKVNGVVNTSDFNSHVNADFWAYKNVNNDMSSGFDSNWFSISTYNYVILNESVDLATFQADLDSMVARHIYPMMESTLSFEDWYDRDDSFLFIAQPISDIYLKSTLSFDLVSGGDETTVYALLITALLIILIAAVNFINLTTARAINRAKEVGVKKSLGSSRSSLIAQFLIESITISLLAMVLAMGFSELFLIVFKFVTGQSLLMDIFTGYKEILWLILISLSIGLIAGIYPAFYLSGFKTIHILKGGFGSVAGKSSFRNVLVVFQFFLSISLICLAWIVHDQLDFLKNKDLGFDQEHVLIIDNAAVLNNNAKVFKEQLNQRSEVVSSTFFRRMPGSTTSFSMTSISLKGEEQLNISRFRGDKDFIETLGFDLIAGRNFGDYSEAEEKKVILNESAVKALMIEHPIGVQFENGMEVIGVVRDFNFENIRHEIAPAIIQISPDGKLAFKLKSAQVSGFIKYAETKWGEMNPIEPMGYHFLDQNFGAMIAKERVLGKAIGIFTILSIFISCLGLYGLSSFMALQRKKEIGIRKVLGASVFKMWVLLSKQFTKLIIIASIIAIPMTVLVANFWLDGFAYKVTLSPGIFIISGAAVLFIALCTVGYESIKAAISNPVESLKEE